LIYSKKERLLQQVEHRSDKIGCLKKTAAGAKIFIP
jgi:hypothetical protein